MRGGNTVAVTGWTGSGTLTGTGDTVVESTSANVTLTNTSLAVSGLPTLTLSGITTANLTVTTASGNSSDIINASAFSVGPTNLTAAGTGNAILFGGTGGHDTLTVAAAALWQQHLDRQWGR